MCHILRSLHRNLNITVLSEIFELCKHTAALKKPANVTCSVCQSVFLIGKQFHRLYHVCDYCIVEDILCSAEVMERRVRCIMITKVDSSVLKQVVVAHFNVFASFCFGIAVS
jgi:hypothetical protein